MILDIQCLSFALFCLFSVGRTRTADGRMENSRYSMQHPVPKIYLSFAEFSLSKDIPASFHTYQRVALLKLNSNLDLISSATRKVLKSQAKWHKIKKNYNSTTNDPIWKNGTVMGLADDTLPTKGKMVNWPRKSSKKNHCVSVPSEFCRQSWAGLALTVVHSRGSR